MLSIKTIVSLTFVVLLIFTISSSVEAFKKLPLNGSMFGKRGTSIEYESAVQKALTAMCEICDRQWVNQDNYVN